MKNRRPLFLLILFTALSISGCGKQYTPVPLCRVVTGVDISCRHEDALIRRHYTDTEKMEAVLNYLRLVGKGSIPKLDPESLDAEVFEITLQLSDGCQKQYRQTAHRYFYRQQGGWQTMEPSHSAKLYTLMRQLPSDGL